MLFFLFITTTILCGFTIAKQDSNIIYIDPGHGGYDGGAFVDEIKEADLNLQISLLLKDILELNGYKVLLTRDTDVDLSTDDKNKKRSDIHNRVNLINNSNCMLYISIHQNTYTNSIYSGAQCFYNSNCGVSQLLANNIQKSIINNLNNTNRVAKNINGIYLIDKVTKPGVLVECGFMSNPSEFKLLQNKGYQYDMANSIYKGILNYLLLI